jgi:hypothetical protein
MPFDPGEFLRRDPDGGPFRAATSVSGGSVARFHQQRRRGGKRVPQIRWKRREIIHAFILIVLMIAFCLWVGIWIATHH